MASAVATTGTCRDARPSCGPERRRPKLMREKGAALEGFDAVLFCGEMHREPVFLRVPRQSSRGWLISIPNITRNLPRTR